MSPESEEAIEIVGELLEEIVEALGIDAEVDARLDGELLTGVVEGEDVGRFIGHHGQMIEAVSHIARRMLLTAGYSEIRVEVDADGYRERRAHALQELAEQAAEQALRERRAIALQPMMASERRIVHQYLRDRVDVLTSSEGDEPQRRLTVRPAA